MQSSSQPLLAQTISDFHSDSIGVQLVVRYLTTPMTWKDYRILAEWLGCYQYTPANMQKPHENTDRPLLEYLVNNTTLTTTQIYHKLIFIKDMNYGLKNSATQLLLSPNSPFMP